MASTPKLESLRLEPATNGIIISYSVCTRPSGGKDVYANSTYESKQEVYKINEAKEAVGRLMEIYEQYNGKAESSKVEAVEKGEY